MFPISAMAMTIQAIRVHQFGDPEVMTMASVPMPDPDPDQVRVQIQAAGVNPVDTYIRAGTYGRLPSLPYTPGIDGAGVVDAVGAAVSHLRVGDRVYGGWPLSGTYAQQALYAADQVFPLPDTVDAAAGACIFVPYSTAYRALFQKGQAQAGETVLVHGATGAVGLAAVQLAVAAGMQVLATGGTETGRRRVRQLGARAVFDHHQPNYLESIREAISGQGLDLIIEMLANVNLGADLTRLGPGGRVVVIGSRGPVTLNPRDLMACEGSITGFTLFNTPPATLAHIQKALYAGLASGSLAPVVAAQFPLAEAPQAHRQVLTAGAQGNIVLRP